jgi:hypothetical protein
VCCWEGTAAAALTDAAWKVKRVAFSSRTMERDTPRTWFSYITIILPVLIEGVYL